MFLSETGATRDAQPRFFCMAREGRPSGLPIKPSLTDVVIYTPAEASPTNMRNHNARTHIHRSSAQPPSLFSPLLLVYFQSTDLLSVHLISSNLQKICIYFDLFSTSDGPPHTSLGEHVCPKGGHVCPPRPVRPVPWWLKGEGRNAKLWCIYARMRVGFVHLGEGKGKSVTASG